jgi:protein-arginine kinase activator protein McsA
MAKHCLNCNTTLSCGCQIRKASDGKEVCTNCLVTYEATILHINAVQNDASSHNIKVLNIEIEKS